MGQGHTENPAAYLDVGEAGNNWWAGSPQAAGDVCLYFNDQNIAISPPKGLKEGTTRNETFYVMPISNPGTYGDKSTADGDEPPPPDPSTPVTLC